MVINLDFLEPKRKAAIKYSRRRSAAKPSAATPSAAKPSPAKPSAVHSPVEALEPRKETTDEKMEREEHILQLSTEWSNKAKKSDLEAMVMVSRQEEEEDAKSARRRNGEEEEDAKDDTKSEVSTVDIENLEY